MKSPRRRHSRLKRPRRRLICNAYVVLVVLGFFQTPERGRPGIVALRCKNVPSDQAQCFARRKAYTCHCRCSVIYISSSSKARSSHDRNYEDATPNRIRHITNQRLSTGSRSSPSRYAEASGKRLYSDVERQSRV